MTTLLNISIAEVAALVVVMALFTGFVVVGIAILFAGNKSIDDPNEDEYRNHWGV